jgi:hypothetical protein
VETFKDRLTQGAITDAELINHLLGARSLQGLYLGEYGPDNQPGPEFQPDPELTTQVQRTLAARHPGCVELIKTFEQVSLERGYNNGLQLIKDHEITYVKRLVEKDRTIAEFLATSS